MEISRLHPPDLSPNPARGGDERAAITKRTNEVGFIGLYLVKGDVGPGKGVHKITWVREGSVSCDKLDRVFDVVGKYLLHFADDVLQ